MSSSLNKTVEELIARYEKSLADFRAINDELRTLPPSDRLTEILELNEGSMSSTARLLDSARQRLRRESHLDIADPFTESQPQTA